MRLSAGAHRPSSLRVATSPTPAVPDSKPISYSKEGGRRLRTRRSTCHDRKESRAHSRRRAVNFNRPPRRPSCQGGLSCCYRQFPASSSINCSPISVPVELTSPRFMYALRSRTAHSFPWRATVGHRHQARPFVKRQVSVAVAQHRPIFAHLVRAPQRRQYLVGRHPKAQLA